MSSPIGHDAGAGREGVALRRGRDTTEPTDLNSRLSHRFQNILVPVDFSTASLNAVRYAQALAGQSGGALSLLHVVDHGSVLLKLLKVPLLRADHEAVRATTQRLIRLSRAEIDPALRRGTLLHIGQPARGITAAAREQAIDLVVMVSHGGRRLKHFFRASLAERVVRDAPCPTLTLREELLPQEAGEQRGFPPIAWKHILVAVDFTDASSAALRFAAGLAGVLHAQITLSYVPALCGSRSEVRAVRENPFQTHVTEALAHELSTWVAQEAPAALPVEILPEIGTPTSEGIAQTARRAGSDLLVLGSRAHPWWERLAARRIAERLSRTAPCPLLTVPANPVTRVADAAPQGADQTTTTT
ncbi:MAG: universal stress protein [Verrucomicrobia bacterium]|nr:universal stress protein [Verrucomicrobiota bacterium]